MNKNTNIVYGIIGLVLGFFISSAIGNLHYRDSYSENEGHNGIMMNQTPYGTNPTNWDGNMTSSMNGMMVGLEGKTGDAFDQAFLSEMIVHHEGAVDMAQSALVNAKHQEIKDLANGIISAQNKEITEMKAWQKAWYNQ